MSLIPGSNSRDVVPRWRPVAAALRAGELASLQPASSVPLIARDESAARAFEIDPGVFTAGDFLDGASAARQRTSRTEAAARLLLTSRDAPLASKTLAARHLDQGADTANVTSSSADPLVLRARVRQMRSIVRAEPKNALRWTDLALAHANLGDHDSALREIKIATSVAPHHRHVLRSAARLYVLVEEPDRAHDLLKNSETLPWDPWVQSAEISVASIAGVRPRSVRKGVRLLRDGTVAPWHTSELASELATLEFRAGNMKNARKLMRASLQEPTENAVAQAQWALREGLDGIDAASLIMSTSFEAQTIQKSAAGDFEGAIQSALMWQSEQPFAPEPAIMTCYLASTGPEDYGLAIKVARRGLQTNPDAWMLHNNLAFALILNGQLAAGAKELQACLNLRSDSLERGTARATAGLLSFRAGDDEQGRRLYEEAIKLLGRQAEPRSRALAHLFWAREELRLGSPYAAGVVREALEWSRRVDDAGVNLWRDRLTDMSKRKTGEASL